MEEERGQGVSPLQWRPNTATCSQQLLSCTWSPSLRERHDQVLQSIGSALKEHLPPAASMTIDLQDQYQFPVHIVATDLRPDIAIWTTEKELILIELTGVLRVVLQ